MTKVTKVAQNTTRARVTWSEHQESSFLRYNRALVRLWAISPGAHPIFHLFSSISRGLPGHDSSKNGDTFGQPRPALSRHPGFPSLLSPMPLLSAVDVPRSASEPVTARWCTRWSTREDYPALVHLPGYTSHHTTPGTPPCTTVTAPDLLLHHRDSTGPGYSSCCWSRPG